MPSAGSEMKQFVAKYFEETGRDTLTKKQKIALEMEFAGRHRGDLCKCGRVADTIDHIVPKRLLLEFGVNELTHFNEDNLQMMCKHCNTFKGGRLDFSNPRTLPLLKFYVNQIEP